MMAENITVNEFSNPDDPRKPHWEYVITKNDPVKRKHKLSSSDESMSVHGNWLHHYAIGIPKQFFSDLFLPIDYPHSVRSEYMAYQVCDSLQGLSSYLRGVVASSAVLEAAGVGNAEATAMSAAMTWALRDGLGMVGGLIFSYTTSFHFDAHVKEFRLFADIINDVGLTLDMLAPRFSNLLYITSVATVCKIMCGISAGATKGSITQHFCLRGNMADLNAKEGTQETLVSLIGMICGVYLAKYLSQVEKLQGKGVASSWSWSIFNVLTLLHVYINYLGVKLLRLRTLNNQRTRECLSGIISSCASNLGTIPNGSEWLDEELLKIPTPESLSESLLQSTYSLLFPRNVRLNAPFQSLSLSMDEILEQLSKNNAKHLIACDGKIVRVSLLRTAQDADQLKAFLQASIIAQCIARGTFSSSTVQQSYQCIELIEERGFGLDLLAERGWDVADRLYLGYSRRRISVVTANKEE